MQKNRKNRNRIVRSGNSSPKAMNVWTVKKSAFYQWSFNLLNILLTWHAGPDSLAISWSLGCRGFDPRTSSGLFSKNFTNLHWILLLNTKKRFKTFTYKDIFFIDYEAKYWKKDFCANTGFERTELLESRTFCISVTRPHYWDYSPIFIDYAKISNYSIRNATLQHLSNRNI